MVPAPPATQAEPTISTPQLAVVADCDLAAAGMVAASAAGGSVHRDSRDAVIERDRCFTLRELEKHLVDLPKAAERQPFVAPAFCFRSIDAPATCPYSRRTTQYSCRARRRGRVQAIRASPALIRDLDARGRARTSRPAEAPGSYRSSRHSSCPSSRHRGSACPVHRIADMLPRCRAGRAVPEAARRAARDGSAMLASDPAATQV